MKLSPEAQAKMQELAESYPQYYEVTYMNADTPRMSGEHYLKFGYKAGFSAGYAFAREEERARSQLLVDAIEYAFEMKRLDNPVHTHRLKQALANYLKESDS